MFYSTDILYICMVCVLNGVVIAYLVFDTVFMFFNCSLTFVFRLHVSNRAGCLKVCKGSVKIIQHILFYREWTAARGFKPHQQWFRHGAAVQHGRTFTGASQMTRRAFLSSRVIQRQEKLRSKRLVKNYGKWFTKMKISQNPWIRFTSKQFSHLRQGKTYPGIHPLCLFMRFRKICTLE